jgi:hypothetical protein
MDTKDTYLKLFDHQPVTDTLSISIQGHRGAYCDPRKDGLEPDEYETFEIAFMGAGGLCVPDHLEDFYFAHDTVRGYCCRQEVARIVDVAKYPEHHKIWVALFDDAVDQIEELGLDVRSTLAKESDTAIARKEREHDYISSLLGLISSGNEE